MTDVALPARHRPASAPSPLSVLVAVGRFGPVVGGAVALAAAPVAALLFPGVTHVDPTPTLDALAVPLSVTPPVLLLAGRHDAIVPAPLTERLSALLEEGGAVVTLEWRDAGHQLTSPELDLSAQWFLEHASPA